MQERDLTGRQEYIDEYYSIWKEAHRSAMSYMAETMAGMYDGLQSFFSDIITGTKSIGDAWRSLGQSILKIIADIAAKWFASRITSAVSTLFSGFGSLSGTAGANGSGASYSSALPISTGFRFASGGDYSGGLALVGEKGPELINFNTGGRVYNAKDTRDMLSGSSSPTIIMNITTPDASSFRQSKTQIAASLHAALAQGRRNL